MKRSWLVFPVILLFATLLTLGHSPLHNTGIGTDQGIYQYVGRIILDHGVPYRDAWDHKQPLTYLFHAIGLLITSHSFWGIWLVNLLLLTLTGFASFILLKKLVSPAICVLIVFSSMLSISVLSSDVNPEVLALPFYMISLVLFCALATAKLNSHKRNFYSFLIGALIAGGFFLKQSLISVGASVIIVIFLDILIHRKWSEVATLLFMGMGFLLVAFAFVAYLGLNHALLDYWNAAFLFNFMYAQTGLLEKLLSIVDELESISSFPGLFVIIPLWISVLVLALQMQLPGIVRVVQRRHFRLTSITAGLLLLIAVVGKVFLDGNLNLGILKITGGVLALLILFVGVSLSRNGKLTSKLEMASKSNLVVWLHSLAREVRGLIYLSVILVPVTFSLISLSNEHYGYYKITLFPSLILLQGIILHLLLSPTDEKKARTLTLIVAASFWIGSAISPVLNLKGQYQAKPDPDFTEAVAYIKQNTNPGDPIYVWSTDTSLYVESNRRSPTRYFYQIAAIAWDPYEHQFGVVNEILNAFNETKPKLFVISNEIPLTGNLQQCLDSADNFGNESPVFEYVCRNYQLARSYTEFQIFSLVSPN